MLAELIHATGIPVEGGSDVQMVQTGDAKTASVVTKEEIASKLPSGQTMTTPAAQQKLIRTSGG